MIPVWQRVRLGLLYGAVLVLVALPPLAVMILSGRCARRGETDCPVLTSRDLFAGDWAAIWITPYLLAAVLIAFVFRLRSRTDFPNGKKSPPEV